MLQPVSLLAFLHMIAIGLLWIVGSAGVLFGILYAYRYWRRDPSMGPGYLAVQTLCLIFVRCFYRVRAKGLENIPATGGALIVANHVSYVDVVILGVLSRRPIRNLSWEGFERVKGLRLIMRMMGTIPVAEDKAKEAIQRSVEVLKRGELVCIFPEGSLTRNGGVMELRKGFELIARRAGVPIVPVAVDGLWGSMFSFSGGKFFWKWPKHFPRPVQVVVGTPFGAAEHATTRLRLLEHAAEAFAMRPALAGHLGREVAIGLAKKGGRPAMVDRTGARRECSGDLLLALGWLFAKYLRQRTSRQRVAIILPPGLAATVANLGCLWAQKVPVNLNFTLGREQILSGLRRAEVDVVITAAAFQAKVQERVPDFPWGDQVCDVGAFLTQLSKAKVMTALAMLKVTPAFMVPSLCGITGQGGDAEAALLFTSGSSGEPKGVVLTHRNLLANLRQIEDADILPEDAVLLSSLPVFHSFGFTIGLWYALSRPVLLVTLPSPLDSAAAVKAIREEKVTVTVGTPTFLRPYLKRATAEDLATLEWAVVGAEKCPKDLRTAFLDQLDTKMLEGYGITETSPVLSVNLPNRQDAEASGGVWVGTKPGSVGRPVMGVAVRFRDVETGALLPVGQTGLLEVWGANIFDRYLHDPERTAEVKSEGWYRTGDLAHLDEAGFLHLSGRLSRFSKIGGEMVPHVTIEELLRKILGLTMVAELKIVVSSVNDAIKGEQLVVLHTEDLDVEAIRAALAAEGVSNLWIPKVFKKIPAVPILGTGKLDLHKLRELAQG
jgi:acyl-[acyl-carrier-protein]-phospholipid O-acyltransferase / long-chain-fatty-acid--[acyl-carrier-protein] ligase